MSYYDDVRQFHLKFGLRVHPAQLPRLLDHDVFEFRLRLMGEELSEFMEAHNHGELTLAADALADLVWVALGTAHMMGIPFDEIWAEVQRANMTKERATGAHDPRSKRSHELDVVKPEGWVPPDHGPALRAARCWRSLSAKYPVRGGDKQ